jgi:hypothetical protein
MEGKVMTDDTPATPSAGIPLEALVPVWLRLREELARLEAAEHPDLVDGRGRVWTWWKGDLYRNGHSAYPLVLLPEPVSPATARRLIERVVTVGGVL